MNQSKKVTITIAGGPGNGIPSFAMLIARACANAQMKCTMDQRLLQDIDEANVRKIGPDALSQVIADMAESGVEVELVIEQTAKPAAEILPPPGAGFVKDHPMAPEDSPFAEVAKRVQEDREIAKEFVPITNPDTQWFVTDGAPMTGYRLLLPGPSGYHNGRTEVPPGVIPVVENPTPAQVAYEKAGLLGHFEALAGGYAFLAKHGAAYLPRVQRVRVQAGFVFTEETAPEQLPANPFVPAE